MNIHMLKLGLDDTGKARAGSLEMMQEVAVQTQLWAQNPSAISAQVDDTTENPEAESLSGEERYDIVIMNPPFTADSKRHDQLGRDIEKQVKDREDELFAKTSAVRTHPGGMFLLLGQRLARENSGKIAVVLPSTGATNPSTAPVWQKLFQNFFLEYVVCSHDPTHIAFSENTTISEMLVVLRVKDKHTKPEDAKFVRLARNPDRPSTALIAANSIRNGDTSGFSGAVTLWPHERVKMGDWSPVKLFSDYLVARVWEWFIENQDSLFVPLGNIAEVGPAGGNKSGVWIRSDIPDQYGRQAMWFNDQSDKPKFAATKICMEQTPDSYIHAKPHAAKERIRKQKGDKPRTLPPYADELWEQRGCLMLPTKISTTSVVTSAIRSIHPVLGSAWVPVRHKTNPVGCDWEKAMCVYLNSTVGILAALHISSPFKLVLPKMSLEGQRKIPIPKLDKDQIANLAAVYDTHKHTRLERLRFPNSEPRIALDQAIAETIGIPQDQIDTARRELAEEPGITGRPHKSVKSGV